MYRDEQIIYGLLSLGALGFYFFVIPWQIEEPEWVTISPALLPRICTILIFILAISKLFLSFFEVRGPYFVTLKNYVYLLGILLILTLATLAMYQIGFWASATTVLVVLQLISRQRNLLVVVLFAAALVGISWLLLDLAGLYIIAPY